MYWNQQNLYPRVPTVVAELLQYSGLGSNTRMRFLRERRVAMDCKWCFLFGFQDFVKTVGVLMVKTGNKLK